MTEINNLNDAILSQVRNYTQDVKEKIEAAAKESAQALVKDLKQTSPKREGAKGGSYRKGWRVKKKGKVYVVHNKTDYRLTHLLEHGHAKRGGGRVHERIHIAPAEDKAVRQFLDKVEDVIKP